MVRFRKTLLLTVFSLAVAVFTCLLCEGTSSVFLVVRDASGTRPLAERSHTEYDEELGWVNLPDLFIKDLYGPGVYLKTNAQSFRNNHDFSATTPNDKVRIICSGDSFTFGYGVDNDHTWCQLLASKSEQLESVNMGQGGYGVDQAYLWYKRDGNQLDHDIHIFTFITDDFARMQDSSFLGYGKPVLALEDNVIVTRNVPVPKRSFYTPWLIHALRSLNNLRSIRLSQELVYRGDTISTTSTPNQEVVLKIIEDLYQTNQAKDSTLVLVYLPTREDFTEDKSESWRQLLDAEADKNNWLFVDLIDEFRKLPPQQVGELFISEDIADYYGAAGHYTEKGNKFIADTLYQKFLSIQQVSDELPQTQ
jgi:hypothetical protein